MKKHIFWCGLMLIAANTYAQNHYKGAIKVDIQPVKVEAGEVGLSSVIDLGELSLNGQEMVVFVPKLISADGQNSIAFDPITISGKKRAKALNREVYFGHGTVNSKSENLHILPSKGASDVIRLNYNVPLEPWMNHSRMIVEEQTLGCYTCKDSYLYPNGNKVKIYEGELYAVKEIYIPKFQLIYIIPPVETTKVQSDTYSAKLQFPVNQSTLLRQFGDNTKVLNEADELINRFRTDSLLSVRRIAIKGYASPEGNEATNVKLSEERANAFMSYLYSRHSIRGIDRMITALGMGEDWDGLRRAVENSNIEGREQILEIIDNTSSNQQRKAYLKSLSGGRAYKNLLEYIYPSLRRNEYTVEYEVRGFNTTEATEILKTRPKLLSLNEMFMVANQYERDSERYKKVFEIAAQIYPDSEIAQLNVAAAEIENGSYESAIKRLSKINSIQAHNNLAIALWKQGDFKKAEELFRLASTSGNEKAKQNIDELTKWIDSNK